MNNNLFKKFMEFGIGSIITLILGFISSPIVTRLISPEQNGRFSIFNTVTNLLMVIVILGLDQSYVRYYYEEEQNNRGKLLRSCIKIPLIINFFVCILLILLYKPISIYIVEERSLITTILLSINLLISIISRFALLQVRMKQKAKLYSLLNIVLKVCNLFFVISLFHIFNNSHMTLILANIFAQLIVIAIAIIIEQKEWRSIGDGELNTAQGEIIKYGAPLVFSMAITWIFQAIDRITIKEFSGFTEVGLYSGAMTIIALLNVVQSTFTTFWTPVAFEKYSQDPEDTSFFSNINKIVTVTMLVCAVFIIACKDMLVLLLGHEYREAVFIFPFLVFMPIMYTISETTVIGINFKKRPKYHINVAIISAGVNFIGNIILVPKYGATGAAISTGLAYIIFFIARTYFSYKLYRVNYSLKKFAIAIIFLFILATYSSFHKFNLQIAILTLVNLGVVVLLYKEILIELLDMMRKKLKRI